MKKILLVCNAGMSTSLLVTNMMKYADSQNLELEIKAIPLTQAEKSIQEWDIVMLGPQVRHCLKQIETRAEGKVPVEIIDMRDYGMMNGENVVKKALEVIG